MAQDRINFRRGRAQNRLYNICHRLYGDICYIAEPDVIWLIHCAKETASYKMYGTFKSCHHDSSTARSYIILPYLWFLYMKVYFFKYVCLDNLYDSHFWTSKLLATITRSWQIIIYLISICHCGYMISQYFMNKMELCIIIKTMW